MPCSSLARVRPAIAFPLLAALALAACGESLIDAGTAERFVRGVVAEQVQARVARVTCPEDVEKETGARFTCVVTGTDGSKGDVAVTQQKRSVLSVNAPFLNAREAEAVMTEQIEKQDDVDEVTVVCPEIVVDRKDALFRCRATSDGRTRNVTARLTGERGRFTYRPPDFS